MSSNDYRRAIPEQYRIPPPKGVASQSHEVVFRAELAIAEALSSMRPRITREQMADQWSDPTLRQVEITFDDLAARLKHQGYGRDAVVLATHRHVRAGRLHEGPVRDVRFAMLTGGPKTTESELYLAVNEHLYPYAPGVAATDSMWEWLERRQPAKLRQRAAVTGKEPDQDAVKIGEGQYQINGEEIRVTDKEDTVLTALIEYGPLENRELIDRSGYEDAAKVLRNLTDRYNRVFAPLIDCPGRRGRGGYSTSIRRSR